MVQDKRIRLWGREHPKPRTISYLRRETPFQTICYALPRTIWPPAGGKRATSKVHTKSAKWTVSINSKSNHLQNSYILGLSHPCPRSQCTNSRSQAARWSGACGQRARAHPQASAQTIEIVLGGEFVMSDIPGTW
jgi:hypothetical protein